MIPYFEFETIDLGFVKIQTWGLLLALGFLIAFFVARREFQRKNLPVNQLLDLTIIILLSAIIGARLFYVFNEFSLYRDNLIDIVKIWEGGLAFYGGLMGATLGSLIYIRSKKLEFLRVADAVFLVLPLGEFITRIGCFLIHDHLGRLTNLPWGINYLGEVRHETAMYSAINGLVLFLILYYIRKKKFAQTPGLISGFYMVWYGFASFAIYQLRATDLPGSDPRLWLFTPSQYFCVALMLIGITVLIKIRRRQS
jgi:phosphatidylglycerol:prolipoprotein diacylglycerol transferase